MTGLAAIAAFARRVGAPVAPIASQPGPLARARVLGWVVDLRPAGLLIDAAGGDYDPVLLDELAVLVTTDHPSVDYAEGAHDA